MEDGMEAVEQRFAHCVEAEPKLGALRKRVDAGDVNQMEGEKLLHGLVGTKRYLHDFDAAQKGHPCPKDRDPGLFALEVWERSIPKADARWRLYGTPSSDFIFEQFRDLLWAAPRPRS